MPQQNSTGHFTNMKLQVIKDPVYMADIVVISNASAHDINKWSQKKMNIDVFPPEWGNNMIGGVLKINNEAGGTFYIVWFKEDKPALRTVCHETLHLIAQVLDDRLCDFDPQNQEPYAYYMDFMFGSILRVLPKNLEIG